ncbi:MAG: hypothetical protein JNM69_37930 [Archangium sp.]|nr:hypothetical protein [Archangium sp.]
MSRLLALLLLLALTAEAGPKKGPARTQPRPPPPPAKPKVPLLKSSGEVTWAGTEFAFVDRGSADGVEVGKPLLFTRAGRSSGSCNVVSVSEHSARCTGLNVRVGDRFNVSREQPPPPEGPKPLPTEAELKRRGALVESNEWALRAFDGARGLGEGLHANVAISHTTFFNATTLNVPTNLQRVDATVIDFEIYKGLRASVDVTVLNFSSRPDAPRTVYQQTPVLLVRQLELGFRRADLPFSAALGRSWLTTGPSLLVLDGAHATYRLGVVELGAFAGLLPDGGRLTPSFSQWSAGAFSRVQLATGEGSAATIVQLAGRAGYALRDTVGSRFEAAVGAGLWAGTTFDANASVEVGYGDNQAPAGIDAARVDLGYRPTEKLTLFASGRYRGLPVSGLTEVGLISPGLRALHADAMGSYEVSPGVIVGLRGGVASDFHSSLLQARFGPELTMPSMFGLPLALGVGYTEELGWLRGRTAFLSFGISAGSVFRVTSRTSLFHQQPVAGAEGLASAEIGQSLAIEVAPWRFLRARVLVMGRQSAGERFAPFGSIGGQLSGSF